MYQVKKRDGKIADFNLQKISAAITKAFEAQELDTHPDIIDMLGLNIHKAVILSVVREDLVDTIMNRLEEKFVTIKNGKGVAFAVPLSSVIGVNLYQFLSNNRLKRGE